MCGGSSFPSVRIMSFVLPSCFYLFNHLLSLIWSKVLEVQVYNHSAQRLGASLRLLPGILSNFLFFSKSEFDGSSESVPECALAQEGRGEQMCGPEAYRGLVLHLNCPQAFPFKGQE